MSEPWQAKELPAELRIGSLPLWGLWREPDGWLPDPEPGIGPMWFVTEAGAIHYALVRNGAGARRQLLVTEQAPRRDA